MFIKHIELNKKELFELAYKNLGVNYFILMGLSISKAVYSEVYYIYHQEECPDQLEAILFKRQSGNLQLMTFRDQCNPDVILDFKEIITSLDFKKLICSQNYVNSLQAESLFSSKIDGAFIHATQTAKLSKENIDRNEYIRPLISDDVHKIEALYKLVFDSFTPPQIMCEKLDSGRGRGLGLFHNDQLIAVAQTDFETNRGAIIVGVATHPDFQKQGYGHKIMSALCQPLIDEGKEMMLHFDSPVAGKLYNKMGFVKIDQIGHYHK